MTDFESKARDLLVRIMPHGGSSHQVKVLTDALRAERKVGEESMRERAIGFVDDVANEYGKHPRAELHVSAGFVQLAAAIRALPLLEETEGRSGATS